MLKFIYICIFYLLTVSVYADDYSQYNNWQTYKPLRSVSYSNPIIKDVEEHIPAHMAPIYRDSDPVTWVHEMTHGINAYLRNNSTGKVNAFYCLNGHYVIFPEPNCKKHNASEFIPNKYKSSSLYSLYVSGQQAWDNEPLYLLDEWISYTNGSEVGTRPDTVHNMLIFNFYIAGTLRSIQKYDPNYKEMDNLKKFMLWNIGRTFRIAKRYPQHEHLVNEFQQMYFNKILRKR